MTTKRLLCLDVDGTLINSQHQITAATRDAIQRADALGSVIVALVSARPPTGLHFLVQELGIDAPLACYNGAYILDPAQNLVSETWLDPRTVRSIYRMSGTLGLSFNLYKGSSWFIDQPNSWSDQEAAIIRSAYQVNDLEALLSQWQAQGTGPNKILVMGEAAQIARFDNQLGQSGFSSINRALSKSTYLEICPATITKATALKALQAHYGIDSSQTIAIGDNYNDLAMLESAGLGIAMANAPDVVKMKSRATTASNDEDGVAQAIERYLLSSG